MKFVKEENGNVRVTDDAGDNISLIQDIGTRVQAEGLVDSISLSQNGFEILRFATADVTGTRVLPASEIPFAGTTSDLIQILLEDFFLLNQFGISANIPNQLIQISELKAQNEILSEIKIIMESVKESEMNNTLLLSNIFELIKNQQFLINKILTS